MFDLSKTKLRRFLLATAVAVTGGLTGAVSHQAVAAEGVALPHESWSFDGPFGTFDRAQLQRGFQVYKEVCSSCHGLDLVAFRNLAESGGPEFSEDAVKVLAEEYEVVDGPDADGEMFTRPAKLSDRFPSPFSNDNAARASNNGSLPPDLSVIAKARHGGADYIYGLMIGYEEAPADVELRDGMSYNAYFAGHQIAMPAPLFEEAVEYTDGSPMTVEQYAKDISAFLTWTAEPKLEARHSMGLNVMIYLIILAGLLYAAKRRLFADVEH
jgi:cytochrome c1